MKNKLIYLLLLTLLISDFTWSFVQYYTTMLDGDMAGGIVFNERVQKVLDDPFGFDMLLTGEAHVNPNRFFPHFIFHHYFRIVPQFLQSFVSPVESIYLASALIKTLSHVLILYFLTALSTQSKSIFKIKFLFIALLLTSLFQTYGYNNDMGIIDVSITYAFFYAVPIMFLLFFVYLFYFNFCLHKKPSRVTWILLILLSIFVPFTGSIIPPTIILIFGFLALIYLVKLFKIPRQNRKETFVKIMHGVTKELMLFCGFFILLNFYSLYIGSFDIQFDKENIPVAERYSRLLKGIHKTFLSKSGFTSLFQLLFVNSVVIFVFLKNERKHYKLILLTVFAFSVGYLALLPLGGYRPYRPLIIRYDSIIPITLALFFLSAYSTNKVFDFAKKNKLYTSLYIVIVGIFIYSYSKKDDEITLKNNCEKDALLTISQSKEKIVELENNCYVLSWWVIRNINDTQENGKLLVILGVTKDAKMYYSVSKD